MRNLLIAPLCALLVCVYATPAMAGGVIEAHADGAVEEATPWTSLTPNDADDLFHFVIVSDRTGGERRGVFPGGDAEDQSAGAGIRDQRRRPDSGLHRGSVTARP